MMRKVYETTMIVLLLGCAMPLQALASLTAGKITAQQQAEHQAQQEQERLASSGDCNGA